MEDLKTLQSKFLSMQKTGGSFKLSERTVADIIGKILKRGKVKLIHTTSGKEFVSEEKINKEIVDEIKRNNGRVTKLDLSKSLEVPMNVIENKVNLVLSKDKSLNLIEGKIITNFYLDNMTNEINLMLKTNGCVQISELSAKFDLSIEFLKKFLKEKIGSSINAKLFATRLLTDEYVEYQKQRIRPILIATILPIKLTSMLSEYPLDELIIEDIIRDLINSNLIKGKLRANVYEPNIYAECQMSYVRGTVIQNNYIEYAKLKNIGITKNAKEYIKDLKNKDSTFDGGLFLKEYFISSTLKNNFEYTLYDNLSKHIPTNMNSIFYFDLADEDINILLESIQIKPNVIYAVNMNLFPISICDGFVESVLPLIKEAASKQYNSYVTKMKEKKKVEEKPKEKKGKKGKKGKTEIEDEEDSMEEHIKLPLELSKDIFNLFLKSSNWDDLNDKDDTLNEVFDKFILTKNTNFYIQYINEFIKTKSQNLNDPKHLMNQIESEFLELRLVQKSFDLLSKLSNDSNYQTGLKAFVASICKKELTNLLKNILTYQLIHMKSKIDLEKINNPNDRKDVINSLPDDEIREIFKTLNDHLQNKNFTQFMDYLQDNSKNLAISLTSLDKRKEKALMDKFKDDFTQAIDEKFVMLGKSNKKDYISLAIDMCLNALLRKGFLIKLPYELWSIGIIMNLLIEPKLGLTGVRAILNEINTKLNMNDEEFSDQHEELCIYYKKLLNSI